MDGKVRPRGRLPLLMLAGGLLALLAAPWAWRLFAALGWCEGQGEAGLEAFLKVVRRSLLLGLGLPIAIVVRPWREVPPSELGFVGPRARPLRGATAYVVTLLLGVGALALQHVAGWWHWREDFDLGAALARTARVALIPGLGVAIFEELLFRGWLEGRGDGPRRPVRTALIVSAIYAALHAFRPRPLLVDVEPGTLGAFEAVAAWFQRALDPRVFGPTCAGLFLFGMLLSAACRRAGSVWASIGIHAAGITLLQAQEGWLVRDAQPAWSGTGRLLDGLPVMLLLALAAWWLEPTRRRGRGGEYGVG